MPAIRRSLLKGLACAVALGAFGLALSATIHSLLVASTGPHRRLVLLALVVWPIMTGLPAFVVALAAIAIEGARRRYWRPQEQRREMVSLTAVRCRICR